MPPARPAMDLTDRTAAEARALFNELAQEWQNATRFLSSLTDITSHPAYQRIIGMGKAAVPLVLERLRRNPDHWFWALKSITGVDPVNDEARGDLNAMSRAWLDWGRQHGRNPTSRSCQEPGASRSCDVYR